jgi:uncharacterized protein
LIIRVSEIEETLSLKGEAEASRFEGKDDTGFAFASPVSYDLELRKVEDRVTITGAVGCTLSVACGRCLEDFPFSLDGYIDVELVPKSMVPPGGEVELRGKELDTDYYEGDEIDLDALIYEEVLLNIPLQPLCNEACKGLCATCGINRNLDKCECDTKPGTLLGEKLKSFLTQ